MGSLDSNVVDYVKSVIGLHYIESFVWGTTFRIGQLLVVFTTAVHELA